MFEAIAQFWTQNHSNIIVSIIVGFLFFVLGPMGLWFSGKKIRRERIKKAKDTLLDLLEDQIVNKADITLAKLRCLYAAIERDIDIDLTGEYSLNTWFGDVILRFERSRHLSSTQKQEYYARAQQLSAELDVEKKENSAPPSSKKYEDILNELSSAIAAQNTDAAKVLLKRLEEKVAEPTKFNDPFLNIFKMYRRMYQRSPITFGIATIIAVLLYAFILMKIMPPIINRIPNTAPLLNMPAEKSSVQQSVAPYGAQTGEDTPMDNTNRISLPETLGAPSGEP
jgi:hypothetical protein